MDAGLTSLIAASVLFVGGHFAMSHPLRAGMVRAFGANGFQGVYSLVVGAAMVWMYFAFKAVANPRMPLWNGFDDIGWAVASLLTLVAMILLAGSFSGNPALAMPGAEKAASAEPHGVFKITRHPMMWSFALWAIGHIIAAPTARTLVIATAVLTLALAGSHMQDRKKRESMGEAWSGWESRTSYWPRFERIFAVGWIAWAVGMALWLGFSWIHLPLGGWDAGIWRWL